MCIRDRPTANGKGSYDLCLANMKKLVARRGDKEYYIRGTFTAKNLDFTQDVKHLRSLGFEQLSLEPVVLPDDSPYAILESHVQRVLEEYDTLADYVFESRQKPETDVYKRQVLLAVIALVVILIVRAICRKRKNKQDPNKNNRPASSAPWKLPEKKTEDDHGKKE